MSSVTKSIAAASPQTWISSAESPEQDPVKQSETEFKKLHTYIQQHFG